MIRVREAMPADNEGLLALTRATPMEGVVTVRIDRQPEFFALMRLRGVGKTFVALDGDDIVGCFTVTYRVVFVNAQPKTIGYMGDLKIHPHYRGSVAIVRLLRISFDYAATEDVNLYVCVTSDGNERVSPVLQPRLFLPSWQSSGTFRVYFILPNFSPMRNRVYDVEEGNENSIEEIVRLCNEFNRSYQLAPLLSRDDFPISTDSVTRSPVCRVFTARRGGELVGTASAFDLANVKQVCIVSVPFALRVALGALKILTKAVPLFTPPTVGTHLRLLYVRNLACASGCEIALRVLLQHVRRVAYREGYTFVTVGFHEDDPLRSILSRIPRYSFKSIVRVTTIEGRYIAREPTLIDGILSGIQMQDFAIA